jgi:hypothetical protein
MVISFSDDTAFGFLADEGFVVTARASRRANPNSPTWANRGRGQEKVADVNVFELGDPVDPLDRGIDRLAPFSGFDSGDAWRQAMRDLNDGFPDQVWLYFVSIDQWAEEAQGEARLVTDGGHPGDHVVVGSWNDIDDAPGVVSGRDKDLVASVFRDQNWTYVVWIPDFILDDADRDVDLVESSDHLAAGGVSDYSDKAWKFSQPYRETATDDATSFLPKSQVVVFERLDDLDLNTPQQGLTDF